MNDCVIKIIIYVIGSSKERLHHIQLYLHRSWCTHIHKKVSTFICILFVLSILVAEGGYGNKKIICATKLKLY